MNNQQSDSSIEGRFKRGDQERATKLRQLLRDKRILSTEFLSFMSWLCGIWLIAAPSVLFLLVFGHFSGFKLLEFLVQAQEFFIQLPAEDLPRLARYCVGAYFIVGGVLTALSIWGLNPYRSVIALELKLHMLNWNQSDHPGVAEEAKNA